MFLQGSFQHKGKKYKLTLKESHISWEIDGVSEGAKRHSVHLSEIICCWTCPKGCYACIPPIWADVATQCQHWKKGCGGLSIELCRRTVGHRWTNFVFSFLHSDRVVLQNWHSTLWKAVMDLRNRPRNLLIVINPVSGRRKAKSVYAKKVAPLFRRGRIQTSILQTEYKGHGIKLINEAKSSGLLGYFDGIVAVGGDGLASEVATGIFYHVRDQKKDSQNLELQFPDSNIRLGIIPSGSTDATCFATNGCNDVVTAALHILMGDRRAVDVASLYTDDGRLQRVVTSLISYGYFGDVLHSSENWRWIGPPRYLFAGVGQLFKNNTYPVKIKVRKKNASVVTSNNDEKSFKSSQSCNSLCVICADKSDDSEADEWEEVVGNYSIVSAAVTSCACRLTPLGVSPLAHLGDGCTDLILVEGSSRAKLLSYLYHTSVTGNAANLDYVKVIRTNEIHLSAPLDNVSSFNCDGEEIESSSLIIRIHRQKLQLFCRGIEDQLSLERKLSQ